jgi:hypothetical protein
MFLHSSSPGQIHPGEIAKKLYLLEAALLTKSTDVFVALYRCRQPSCRQSYSIHMYIHKDSNIVRTTFCTYVCSLDILYAVTTLCMQSRHFVCSLVISYAVLKFCMQSGHFVCSLDILYAVLTFCM